MKAVDIDWDVDREEDRELLPKEVEIPEGMKDEEKISDYLSDVTGFCHKGFRLIEEEQQKALRNEPEQKYSWTEEMIEEVETLHNSTPDGVIHDADTILVDLIEQCDHEFTGFAQDIFNIWKNSTDKKAVEQMFYEFTDMEFDRYLMKCQKEITRGSKEKEQAPERNTKMEYLYCDADNYKKLNVCVIKGQITDEQKAAIMDCLHDGEFFIPSQIGLPEERFDDGPTVADHCWFTLDKEGFGDTDLEPTVDVSANELVAAFQNKKGRWDDGIAFGETDGMPLSFADAKGDILAYLSAQKEAYFLSRGATKAAVLQNPELIDTLAAEHRKCVNNFGNDREWSCKDACDAEPGIRAIGGKAKPSLPEQIQSAAARPSKVQPDHSGKAKDREPSISQ